MANALNPSQSIDLIGDLMEAWRIFLIASPPGRFMLTFCGRRLSRSLAR